MNVWKAALLAALALLGCKRGERPPSLADALDVEQPGGSVAQLVSQGSELPTSATESFTTAHDGDRRLAIHVLRGSGRTADKLRSDGWWVVEGVRPAKAGDPRVLVTFEIDAQGGLSLSAREEDRRLEVKKLSDAAPKLVPSPLSEPDDDEDEDER